MERKRQRNQPHEERKFQLCTIFLTEYRSQNSIKLCEVTVRFFTKSFHYSVHIDIYSSVCARWLPKHVCIDKYNVLFKRRIDRCVTHENDDFGVLSTALRKYGKKSDVRDTHGKNKKKSRGRMLYGIIKIKLEMIIWPTTL